MDELFQLQSGFDNSNSKGNKNKFDLKMFRVTEVQVISIRLYNINIQYILILYTYILSLISTMQLNTIWS